MLLIAIQQATSLSDFRGLIAAYLGLPVRKKRLLVDPLESKLLLVLLLLCAKRICSPQCVEDKEINQVTCIMQRNGSPVSLAQRLIT